MNTLTYFEDVQLHLSDDDQKVEGEGENETISLRTFCKTNHLLLYYKVIIANYSLQFVKFSRTQKIMTKLKEEMALHENSSNEFSFIFKQQ